jgi:hypothetical protein
VGLASGELHNVRTEASRLAAENRHWPSPRKIVAGRHFGDDKPGAEALGDPPEWGIRDPGHWGEEHPVGDLDVANPKLTQTS